MRTMFFRSFTLAAFVTGVACGACNPPVDADADADDEDEAAGGKADGAATGLLGTWQADGSGGAFRLLRLSRDGSYRRLPAAGPEEDGFYELGENEWGQPRLVFQNELGNPRDAFDYALDTRSLTLTGPASSFRMVPAAGTCRNLGGTCRDSWVTPGLAPSCADEWGEEEVPAFCADFSQACCATPTGW